MKKIIFAIIVLGATILFRDNTTIETSEHMIVDEKIPEAFNGYTIVQVSDLHNSSLSKKLLKEIEKEKPDLIVLTGDLIDSYHTKTEVSLLFVEEANKIAPIYYITGNHEARVKEYPAFAEKLKEMQIRFRLLNDEKVLISSPTEKDEKIELIGLEDPAFVMNEFSNDKATAIIEEKLEAVMEENEYYKILLAHRPEHFEAYAERDIDLALTGHVHGGQVRIPGRGALFTPSQGFFPKYSEGMYEKNGTKMIVSRGIGNSIIPVRVNNRPNLVVIKLHH